MGAVYRDGNRRHPAPPVQFTIQGNEVEPSTMLGGYVVQQQYRGRAEYRRVGYLITGDTGQLPLPPLVPHCLCQTPNRAQLSSVSGVSSPNAPNFTGSFSMQFWFRMGMLNVSGQRVGRQKGLSRCLFHLLMFPAFTFRVGPVLHSFGLISQGS